VEEAVDSRVECRLAFKLCERSGVWVRHGTAFFLSRTFLGDGFIW
jgi:hypothetical protein